MLPQLATQPYEQRCAVFVHEQTVPLPNCCPVTRNPQAGSTLTLIYQPSRTVLEVKSLAEYVESYKGGREGVRDMEGMIAQIAQDCANTVGVRVEFKAVLEIEPGTGLPWQKMLPSGHALPTLNPEAR